MPAWPRIASVASSGEEKLHDAESSLNVSQHFRPHARVAGRGPPQAERALLDLTRKLVLAESPSEPNPPSTPASPSPPRTLKHSAAASSCTASATTAMLSKPASARATQNRAPPSPSCSSAISTPSGPSARSNPCPAASRDGRLWGPGTLDMKAGVAMAFTAIEMLAEAGLLHREIVLLLNSDEEIGSPVSRPITEHLARQCSAVYVLEPAQGLAYKTARKGTGDWRIDVKGVAAHAGVDFEKGANAIRELARVIETVSGWTDLKRGLTVSVGVAGGGTKSNVVPAEAWAEVDVRIRPPRRRPPHRAQIRRPQSRRPALHAHRHRRHQSPAHGAQPRNRSPLPPSAGPRPRTWL